MNKYLARTMNAVQLPHDVPSFADLVARSCLVSETDLSEAVQRFRQANTGSQETMEEFAHSLVEYGLLTAWQHDKLLSGRFKGFFHGELIIQRQLRKDDRHSYYDAIDPSNGEHVTLRASFGNNGKITLNVVPE